MRLNSFEGFNFLEIILQVPEANFERTPQHRDATTHDGSVVKLGVVKQTNCSEPR